MYCGPVSKFGSEGLVVVELYFTDILIYGYCSIMVYILP